MTLLSRLQRARVADSVIARSREHTVDGRGRRGALDPGRRRHDARASELEEIWTPMYLERLARTYWRYLSRVTLGLIRVDYTDASAASCCCAARSCCCASTRPSTRSTRDRGIVRWRIARRRCSSPARARRRRLPGDRRPPLPGGRARARRRIHVEVEVANFYPAIADLARALVLRAHAVAHPRARHPRLPALARAARPRGVGGRALRRRAPTRAGRPRTSAGHRRRDAVARIARGDRRGGRRALRRGRRGARLARRSAVARRRSAPAASSRSWRDAIRRTVPERERMTSDSVVAPRAPS